MTRPLLRRAEDAIAMASATRTRSHSKRSLIIYLDLAQSFISKNPRLVGVRVREQGVVPCVLCLRVAQTYISVFWPLWSLVPLRLRLQPSSLVWRAVDGFVRETWRPPLSRRISLVESEIKVTGNLT